MSDVEENDQSTWGTTLETYYRNKKNNVDVEDSGSGVSDQLTILSKSSSDDLSN